MASIRPVRFGVIGCGNISNAYFSATKKFPVLQIAAVADIDPLRAKAKAEEHGVAKALTPAELLADREIEVVINLTIPAAHYLGLQGDLRGRASTFMSRSRFRSRGSRARNWSNWRGRKACVWARLPTRFWAVGIRPAAN